MADTPMVYSDDPDAAWTFTVTDSENGTLDWTPVEVAVDSGAYTLAGTWLGSPDATRRVKVPLDSLAPLAQPGHAYTLYLKVPGANDVKLGRVQVKDRV